MVTVDLRKGRHFDRYFDWSVENYGLQTAVTSWLALDKEHEYTEGLLNLWIDGMPAKSIASMAGMRTSDLNKKLRPFKEAYFKRCEDNCGKIESILKRDDPDYEYLIDQRTKVGNMCALLMGGDEIKDVLEQLANLGETK